MKIIEEAKFLLGLLGIIAIVSLIWVVIIYGLAMLFIFLESIHISLVVIVGVPIFFLYAWGFNKLLSWVDRKSQDWEE